jgi:hypothetical protein
MCSRESVAPEERIARAGRRENVPATMIVVQKIDQGLTATATFRLLYVFVVIEHRSRRLIHCNVTAHPTAAWTLQQLREAVGLEERYEYLIHDRDSIFAKHLDESIVPVDVHNDNRKVA